MITPARVIPYLLILILGLFIAYQCNSAKVQQLERFEDNRLHQQRVKVLKDSAALSEAKISALEKARKTSRDSAKVQQRASKVALRANLDTIATLKHKLSSRLQENPDINALVQAQERAYNRLDSLYKGSELHHAAEIVSYEAELKERGKQLMQKDAINELLQSRNQELEKQVKKGQRKVRFFKVVSTVLAGGIVYMSIKE